MAAKKASKPALPKTEAETPLAGAEPAESVPAPAMTTVALYLGPVSVVVVEGAGIIHRNIPIPETDPRFAVVKDVPGFRVQKVRAGG